MGQWEPAQVSGHLTQALNAARISHIVSDSCGLMEVQLKDVPLLCAQQGGEAAGGSVGAAPPDMGTFLCRTPKPFAAW